MLELGGKDPQIVCSDANLPHAISGAVWGGFANAGQTCSGIERTYVMRDVADRFIDGVVREASRLHGRQPARVDHRDRPDGVQGAVRPRLRAGRRRDRRRARSGCAAGPREVPGFSGHFIAPTVLTDVTHDMRIMREEIFGPVLPIVTVDSEQEAIDLANDSQFGLGASVWTLDRDKGERMARQIQSGMVWINDHSYSHGACQCSWGGVKESGLGRSHSKFGFYECANIKLVVLGAVPDARHLVAPVRRGARQGDPRLGAAAVRPRRRRAESAARRRGAAAAGARAVDAAGVS